MSLEFRLSHADAGIPLRGLRRPDGLELGEEVDSGMGVTALRR